MGVESTRDLEIEDTGEACYWLTGRTATRKPSATVRLFAVADTFEGPVAAGTQLLLP